MEQDYKKTIKERLEALPEELKSFVLDEKWREEAKKIGEKFKLDEEKYASFENEIFMVLLCFEPRADFAENIKNELKLDANMIDWIAEDVKKNIFSKIATELDSFWNQILDQETENREIKKPQEAKGDNIGQSFEQIILNQAKAMRPAVASPKLGYGEAKPAQDEQRREAPNNLPIENNEPKAIHNYIGASDPYREPIEN